MSLLVDHLILLCSIHHEQEDIDQDILGTKLKKVIVKTTRRTKPSNLPRCVVEGGKDEL